MTTWIENQIQNPFWEKIWNFIREHKRYVLGILILFIFVVRWLFSWSTNQQTTVSDIYTVKTGNIENSIKVLWTTKIVNQQTLTFWQTAKVTKIYIKEGDIVKAGQLLAEIDKKEIRNSLSQQSLSVQNAKINYDKFLNQYTEADKIQAQNNVDDTQSKLDIAKKELEELKLERWDNLQVNGTKAQDILLTIKNILLDSKNILNNIDDIFGVNNKKYEEDTYFYLSRKSSSYKDLAKNWFQESKRYWDEVNNSVISIQSQSTTLLQTLKDLQDKTKQLINSLSQTINYSIGAVNNSIIDVSLPQTKIDWWITTLNSASSKTLSFLSNINSDIKTLNSTVNDIQTKQNEIKNYEAQLAIYKNTLQETINWPDSQDRTLQLNSLRQSQLSAQSLSQQLENYEIRAPFDGTVDVINFKVWDTPTSTDGIVVSNPNLYEVITLVDQVDIVKVNKWQEAEVSFDAYPWYIVTWEISWIDPTPVTSAGVVSYNVTITLQKAEKKIYDSMTVSVSIIIEKENNVLIIPNTAIKTLTGNIAIVGVINWSDIIRQPISVGITDWIDSEVITGLTLWDKILSIYSTSSSTSTKKASTTSANKSSGSQSSNVNSFSSMRALEWGSAWWPPN